MGRPAETRTIVHSRRTGFTLVELLVVVGIIALLVTLLMPSLSRALEMARRAKCALNLSNMGKYWTIYFQENGETFPGINGDKNYDSTTNMHLDPFSEFALYIKMSGKPTNTWHLWKAGMIQDPNVFICPTTDKSVPYPTWFTDPEGPANRKGAYSPWGSWNDWPPDAPGSSHHCRMTYVTRRMTYYNKADVGGSSPDGSKEAPFMLRNVPRSSIAKPESFSFMADNVSNPTLCKLSHYPGVNVLHLGGHVEFFRDETEDGRILYDGNGYVDYGLADTKNNWPLDRIWMVIDGKMEPLADTLK